MTDIAQIGNISQSLPAVALYLGGMAFSAIHLAAWNWEFPSPLIQALWRWFCLVAFLACLLPFISVAIAILALAVDEDNEAVVETLGFSGALVSLFLLFGYVASRLAILLLIFYCFTSMPASAYEKVVWTEYIPHFS